MTNLLDTIVDYQHAHDGVECASPVRETGTQRFGTIHHGVCVATDQEVDPWET